MFVDDNSLYGLTIVLVRHLFLASQHSCLFILRLYICVLCCVLCVGVRVWRDEYGHKFSTLLMAIIAVSMDDAGRTGRETAPFRVVPTLTIGFVLQTLLLVGLILLWTQPSYVMPMNSEHCSVIHSQLCCACCSRMAEQNIYRDPHTTHDTSDQVITYIQHCGIKKGCPLYVMLSVPAVYTVRRTVFVHPIWILQFFVNKFIFRRIERRRKQTNERVPYGFRDPGNQRATCRLYAASILKLNLWYFPFGARARIGCGAELTVRWTVQVGASSSSIQTHIHAHLFVQTVIYEHTPTPTTTLRKSSGPSICYDIISWQQKSTEENDANSLPMSYDSNSELSTGREIEADDQTKENCNALECVE